MPEQEDYISDLEIDSITRAIEYKYNIIIDATNLNHKTLNKFNNLFKDTGYEIEIKQFHVDFNEAVERDKRRERSIGEKVIRSFFERYVWLDKEGEQYKIIPIQESRFILKQDETLEHCIIVDIDGTLSIMNGRNAFDYDKVDTDLPNNPVIDLVNTLSKTYKIIIVTGRENTGKCKELTETWLKRYLFRYDEIHMRSEKDYRSDDIIKREIYNNFIKDKYCVAGVFDDRDKVVKQWRELGLLCNQVYYGNF